MLIEFWERFRGYDKWVEVEATKFISWLPLANANRRTHQSSSRRAVLYGLLISIVSLVGADLRAQEIKIKLVDGRNGQPLGNTCVNVWVGNERKEAIAIPTDSHGFARLRLTTEDGEVDTSREWSSCGLFGVINPVLKYRDDIAIIAGGVPCQADSGDNSWLKKREYGTKDLVQNGIVTPNTCGKATAERKPGELVIFVRPMTWWEKWKQ